ncbi:MAG: hypothetical protein RL095_2944 [Verrucomicrobiota bacterium]
MKLKRLKSIRFRKLWRKSSIKFGKALSRDEKKAIWETMNKSPSITLAGESSVPLVLGRWTAGLPVLAAHVAGLPAGSLLAFGRQLWSLISNGQMPPGLFDLRENTGLKLLAEDLLMPAAEALSGDILVFDAVACGRSVGISDEEPDFEGSSYLLVLKGAILPTLIPPPGVESRLARGGAAAVQLFLSADFIALEDLADEASRCLGGLEAALFFVPSQGLSRQLSEKLRDKERIRDPFADIRSC